MDAGAFAEYRRREQSRREQLDSAQTTKGYSQMLRFASMIRSALNRSQGSEFCTALRISRPILISRLPINNFFWGNSC
jgi:hypothetical protein